MGRSKSIADKEREDAEFKAFMAKLEADSKAKENEMLQQISARVADFYQSNKWKYSKFFGERRSDYQNYSEWSLESVNKVIATIGNAISAAQFPSPAVPGSEDAGPKTTEEVKENLPSFVADINLTIKRVVAILNGFLTQFASTSSIIQKSAFQDLPLSGGLHLFLSQCGSVYREKRFFSNQYIGSFQIVFEAFMSVEEARAYSILKILKTTQAEIDMISNLIVEIRQEQLDTLKTLTKDPKMFKETKLDFDEMLNDLKNSRDEVVKEYDKYKTVADMVDDLLPMIDLAPLGIATTSKQAVDKVKLNELFDDWEADLAARIIREKFAA